MRLNDDLSEKVTVVTGASSGIGTAIARRFAAAGSRIVLAARREEKLQELAEALRRQGTETLTHATDVTDYRQVEAMVGAAVEKFGQVDILVNNAGNALEKSVADSTPDDFDFQIDVNLKGVCYGCRAVLPHMIERRQGQIVNMGSICSLRHFPNYAAYVAAKWGVLGFSRSLYEEVRPHGIRVNVLCPAAVNTPWADLAGAELPWPPEDRLQPEDLAEMALYCVAAPARVQIETIVAWPVCEPTV